MKVKILKNVKGTWHSLKTGEIYKVPHFLEDKKTKRSIRLEIIETKNTDIFEAGYFLSFSSQSMSAKDGCAGYGCPLRLNKDFVFCENLSASKKNLQEGIQGSLF
jgi:hypothetical protein